MMFHACPLCTKFEKNKDEEDIAFVHKLIKQSQINYVLSRPNLRDRVTLQRGLYSKIQLDGEKRCYDRQKYDSQREPTHNCVAEKQMEIFPDLCSWRGVFWYNAEMELSIMQWRKKFMFRTYLNYFLLPNNNKNNSNNNPL